jgi:hypothetical protein
MKWNGPITFEYNWNRQTGDFFLIEVNARYWAALHLDIMAGVDYPVLHIKAHLGETAGRAVLVRTGVRSRLTFPIDLGNLLSMWHDDSLPWRRKFATAYRFAADFLDPRIRSGLVFAGDSTPYNLSMGRAIKGLFFS